MQVYENPLTIPSYRVQPPEIMPIWRDRVYPYTMLDRLTNEKYEKTYNAVYVENEYVKAMVLPEIGGRLHDALDKTNGYHFLYDQRVIKPGLVGLTGAWISGGVEWNFPDGHRASGFRDTDYRIVENEDGSKTIWTGEIDRISKMRWSVGTTVYPGRNYVETKVRLYNCTPFVNRFQFWATSGVRATQEYQAVIPGEIVTSHGKSVFYRWPVHEGVNLTYWKNLPGASSFFAWETKEDYFGGYSPEEKAGTVHFADHNIVRGKKLWTWGAASSGRLWDRILTDGDLPYFEPQAGGYSNNQPDLHWILPGETKIFSHFWLPVRDIGVWDYANLEGTLNIELEKRKAKFGWSATGENKGARIILTCQGSEIYSSTADVDPGNPFIAQVNAPKGADLYSLKMIVLSAGGDTLLAFQHPRPTNPPLPERSDPYPTPEQTKSQDELFVIGEHFDKFREPETGMLYYQEALKRDPGDLRSNTAVGLIYLKQGRFEQALKHFDKSIERDDTFYKAWYFRGVTQLCLGNLDEAERSFNRSSYDLAYYAAAHFELAQLTVSQGRCERALMHVERSIKGNGDNAQAYAAKALVLNLLGRHDQALAVAEEIQKTDPLEFLSLAEKYRALMNLGRTAEAQAVYDQALKISRLDSDNFLELAIRYARCGQYRYAVRILEILLEKTDSVSPMVYYYLAYYQNLLGNKVLADEYLAKGSAASSKYCFPSRLESLPVFNWAISQAPQDAQAKFLMGNLLYSMKQSEEAIACWEKAVGLDPSDAVAYRNLGYALKIKDDLQGARRAYENAVKADPNSSLAVYELEEIYVDLGVPVEEIIAFLEKNIEAVSKHDQVLKRLIANYVQVGRYKDALKWFYDHYFKSWEGRYDIHQYWVESHIGQGDIELETGNLEKALEHYRLSLEYPSNLQVAPQPRTIHARKRYKVAVALEALGQKKEAREMFNRVAADEPPPENAYQYYKGKALEKLGRKSEALEIYRNMLAALDESSRRPRREGTHRRYDGKSYEAIIHFTRSLALEGLGQLDKAESERKIALNLDPMVAIRAFRPPRAGW